MSTRLLRNAAVLVGLAAVYFVAGKLGWRLASVNASATAVWAPTGIALAAFLILGYRVWPAVLVSAFLVNVTTAGSVVTSIGIGAGNTLEGIVGAYLVNRFASGRNALQRAPDVFKFAALTAIVSTMVSATCGVTSLALAGFADWARYGSIWSTWWLGDAAGALVVAPFVILWSASPRPRWRGSRMFEAALLLLSLSFVGAIVFGGLFPSEVKNYPLEFLCLPLLIWAAFRFGQREVATAVAMLSGIATWGTLHGFGPFATNAQNASLLLLQTFMAVTSLTTLALAAVVSERRAAEKRLRRLTVSDPLTGLGNYRRLIAALEGEIGRSQRTERPFALLFLDLDGLKAINDHHGHLIGNRALCRVAHAFRIRVRSAVLFPAVPTAHVVLPGTPPTAVSHGLTPVPPGGVVSVPRSLPRACCRCRWRDGRRRSTSRRPSAPPGCGLKYVDGTGAATALHRAPSQRRISGRPMRWAS